MTITANMGLTVWDRSEDLYDHVQLANNFVAIDAHDHTSGRGPRIGTAALSDASVTGPKIADGTLTEPKYATGSVSSRALAEGIIGSAQIQNGSVTSQELADRSVTSAKLDANVVPIGTVISWWRPVSSQPVPEGWEIADGHTLTVAFHDFAGGGTITLPDLRNKFILGAATGGTGTGTGTPPAIGQAGGSNSVNLGHSHVVDAHSHSVDQHTHGVAPHTHTVTHRHQVEAHSHSVNAHSHVVPGHSHPIPDHTHSIFHDHFVSNHSHGISGDGSHNHDLNQRAIYVADTPHQYLSKDGAGNQVWRTLIDRQAAYVAGVVGNNGGGTFVNGVPPHGHGGSTGQTGAVTHTINNGTSGVSGGSTNASAGFRTADEGSGTGNTAPFTTTDSPSTSPVSLTTGNGGGGTSSASPGTNSALGASDIRPSFIGLLFLIKVKS